MLAAVRNQTQKAAARVFVLAILIQMDRKFLDTACKHGHLDLRRACVGIVTTRFRDFVLLLTLCKHGGMISHSPSKRKSLFEGYFIFLVEVAAAGVDVAVSTFTSLMSKRRLELAGMMIEKPLRSIR